MSACATVSLGWAGELLLSGAADTAAVWRAAGLRVGSSELEEVTEAVDMTTCAAVSLDWTGELLLSEMCEESLLSELLDGRTGVVVAVFRAPTKTKSRFWSRKV